MSIPAEREGLGARPNCRCSRRRHVVPAPAHSPASRALITRAQRKVCAPLLRWQQSTTTTVPAIDVSKTAEDAQRAAAGFLARYGGPTRRAYGTDLRAWFGWCRDRRLEMLEVKRPHVELWVRAMEEQQHLSSSTVSRRLSTVSGYYRFCGHRRLHRP